MILKFDFDLNVKHLLEIWSKIKHKQVTYKDKRSNKALSHWKIIRHDFEYAKELSKIFNVESRPRFYMLNANTVLQQHTDLGTLCSLNFIFIIFYLGSEVYSPVLMPTAIYQNLLIFSLLEMT